MQCHAARSKHGTHHELSQWHERADERALMKVNEIDKLSKNQLEVVYAQVRSAPRAADSAM